MGKTKKFIKKGCHFVVFIKPKFMQIIRKNNEPILRKMHYRRLDRQTHGQS